MYRDLGQEPTGFSPSNGQKIPRSRHAVPHRAGMLFSRILPRSRTVRRITEAVAMRPWAHGFRPAQPPIAVGPILCLDVCCAGPHWLPILRRPHPAPPPVRSPRPPFPRPAHPQIFSLHPRSFPAITGARRIVYRPPAVNAKTNLLQVALVLSSQCGLATAWGRPNAHCTCARRFAAYLARPSSCRSLFPGMSFRKSAQT